MRPLSCIVALALVAAGCGLSEETAPQPVDVLRLPASVALGGDGARLYVVGTNFDLQFGSGVLQSFDVAELDARIGPPADGEVVRIEDPPLTGAVQIGSFGGRIAVAPTDTGERLFVPTRADGRLAVVDVSEGGALSCVHASDGEPVGPAEDCRDDSARLATEQDETMDDPFSVVVAGDDVFVGALGVQPLNPDELEGTHAVFMARVPVSAPADLEVQPVITLPERTVEIGWLRDLALGPDGRVYSIGTNSNVVFNAEIRSFFPAAFGPELTLEAFDLAFEVGGTDGEALAFSEDAGRAYALTRFPPALTVLEVGEGASGLAPQVVVPLPSGPANLARIPRPGGELLAVTCPVSDGVVLVDPALGEVVGLLESANCPVNLGVCPVTGRDPGERPASLDPGVQPYGLAVTARPGGGARLWVSSFGDDTLRVIDVPDLDRPWELRVVAILGVPATEDET